jgi:hypothetical protein
MSWSHCFSTKTSSPALNAPAMTTEFLTQEADKLKVELEKVETQLAAYKQEHSRALPQHQELRLSMLSRTETELKDERARVQNGPGRVAISRP